VVSNIDPDTGISLEYQEIRAIRAIVTGFWKALVECLMGVG